MYREILSLDQQRVPDVRAFRVEMAKDIACLLRLTLPHLSLC